MLDAVFFDIIDVRLIAVGFLGGLVHAFREDRITPWKAVGFIVTGGAAANFFSPLVAKMLPFVPIWFVAFGVGMSGKKLCRSVERFFDGLNMCGKTKNE